MLHDKTIIKAYEWFVLKGARFVRKVVT